MRFVGNDIGGVKLPRTYKCELIRWTIVGLVLILLALTLALMTKFSV